MGRSLKKGPYVDPKLYLKVEKQNDAGVKDPGKAVAEARRSISAEAILKPFIEGDQINIRDAVDTLGWKPTYDNLRDTGWSAKDASQAVKQAENRIFEEKRFESRNVKLGVSGQYMSVKDFDTLTPQERVMVQQSPKGAAALSPVGLTGMEEFQHLQERGRIPDDQVYVGTEKGQVLYRARTPLDDEKDMVREYIAEHGKPPKGYTTKEPSGSMADRMTHFNVLLIDGKPYWTGKEFPKTTGKEFGIFMGDLVVPFFYVARRWDEIPTWQKALFISLDLAFVGSFAAKPAASTLRTSTVVISNAVGKTGSRLITQEIRVLNKAVQSGSARRIMDAGARIESLGLSMKSAGADGAQALILRGRSIQLDAVDMVRAPMSTTKRLQRSMDKALARAAADDPGLFVGVPLRRWAPVPKKPPAKVDVIPKPGANSRRVLGDRRIQRIWENSRGDEQAFQKAVKRETSIWERVRGKPGPDPERLPAKHRYRSENTASPDFVEKQAPPRITKEGDIASLKQWVKNLEKMEQTRGTRDLLKKARSKLAGLEKDLAASSKKPVPSRSDSVLAKKAASKLATVAAKAYAAAFAAALARGATQSQALAEALEAAETAVQAAAETLTKTQTQVLTETAIETAVATQVETMTQVLTAVETKTLTDTLTDILTSNT